MQGQEAASAQALQALRAWVRSIASSFPSSHRRRRDTEKPDDKDARPVDETNMDDATTRCFALPPCDLDVTLWRGETVGRGGGKRSLSGGLDVLVTSVPAGSFLKLWKQLSRILCMVLLRVGYPGCRQASLNQPSAGQSVPWAPNSGPAFCPRGFENTLDFGVTPLRTLDFYLDWT